MIDCIAYSTSGASVDIRLPEEKRRKPFLRGIKRALLLPGRLTTPEALEEKFVEKGFERIETKRGKVIFPINPRRDEKKKPSGAPRRKKFRETRFVMFNRVPNAL